MKYDFKPYDRVLTRDSENQCWQADIFSHYNKDNDIYTCICGTWSQCIPYKGNENLVGTSDSPIPPEEFNFGDKVEIVHEDGTTEKAIFIDYNKEDTEHPFCVVIKRRTVDCISTKKIRHADW